MKITDLLKSVFEKAGMLTNEKISTLLSNEKLKQIEDIELDAEIANVLNSKVISLDAAKSHPDISAHFKKSYFGTIDKKIKESLIELGISEDIISDIEKLPTDERIANSLKKIKEIETSNKDTDKGKLLEQIQNLQKAINEAKNKEAETISKFQADLQSKSSEIAKIKTDFEVKKLLQKYKFRTDLTPEQIDILLDSQIQKNLQGKKAALVISESGLTLRNAETPDQDYFDVQKGKVIGVNDFFDEIIANSGLQFVADAGKKEGGNNPTNQNVKNTALGSFLSKIGNEN